MCDRHVKIMISGLFCVFSIGQRLAVINYNKRRNTQNQHCVLQTTFYYYFINKEYNLHVPLPESLSLMVTTDKYTVRLSVQFTWSSSVYIFFGTALNNCIFNT